MVRFIFALVIVWQRVMTMQDNFIKVCDLPESERPREKLLKHGVHALNNLELLAILLRSGTKNCSVFHLAERLLALNSQEGLAALADVTAEQMQRVSGIGISKASAIVAAIEFGRRIEKAAAERKPVFIESPRQAADYLVPYLRHARQEKFAALFLDARNRITSFSIISVGTLNASLVHPREVFHAALQRLACYVILAHNHPSGDVRPSKEDIALTRRLVSAGEIIGIPVMDHIIIGGNDYFSLKEEGMME